MKFYVAGKWQDRFLVEQVIDKLEELGHSITEDWTTHEFGPDGVIGDLQEFAVADIEGVKIADALCILLLTERNYKGAWVEMGGALTLSKPVYVIGSKGDSCIFMNHPLVIKLDSVEEFIERIIKEQQNEQGRS